MPSLASGSLQYPGPEGMHLITRMFGGGDVGAGRLSRMFVWLSDARAPYVPWSRLLQAQSVKDIVAFHHVNDRTRLRCINNASCPNPPARGAHTEAQAFSLDRCKSGRHCTAASSRFATRHLGLGSWPFAPTMGSRSPAPTPYSTCPSYPSGGYAWASPSSASSRAIPSRTAGTNAGT